VSLVELARRTYVALVHHPVLDKEGQQVTTAVTNLDIHDIARASRTFGLAGYYVVTPITAQRELVAQIVGHWTRGAGREHNDKRTDALSLVTIVASLDEAIADITARDGKPFVVATGARRRAAPTGYRALRTDRITKDSAMLVVFGTGWGLAEPVFAAADCTLAPIAGPDPNDHYNHLSVRSAVAIVLDRLFGTPERF
jgi:hypothetical protein